MRLPLERWPVFTGQICVGLCYFFLIVVSAAATFFFMTFLAFFGAFFLATVLVAVGVDLATAGAALAAPIPKVVRARVATPAVPRIC